MKLKEKYVLAIRKKSTRRTFYRILLLKQISGIKYSILKFRKYGVWDDYVKNRISTTNREITINAIEESYSIIDFDKKRVFEICL